MMDKKEIEIEALKTTIERLKKSEEKTFNSLTVSKLHNSVLEKEVDDLRAKLFMAQTEIKSLSEKKNRLEVVEAILTDREKKEVNTVMNCKRDYANMVAKLSEYKKKNKEMFHTIVKHGITMPRNLHMED